MNNNSIEIINLKKSFNHANGSITLFNNFNLKKRGRTCCLNWALWVGKSSLLHLIALLDQPTKGKIILNKIDTKNLTNIEQDKLEEIIFLLYFKIITMTDFTAIENVKMPLVIKEENEEVISKKAEKF